MGSPRGASADEVANSKMTCALGTHSVIPTDRWHANPEFDAEEMAEFATEFPNVWSTLVKRAPAQRTEFPSSETCFEHL